VGRRGTGKTTITRFVESSISSVIVVRPEIFSPSSGALSLDEFKDANQRPFRSLTAAFRRTLQDEALFAWNASRGSRAQAHQILVDVKEFSDYDFDLRALAFIEQLTSLLADGDDPDRVRAIKVPKALRREMSQLQSLRSMPCTVLVDAIDEFWDGSELAVIYLAAMMYACVEINSQNHGMRVLMFLRENIFERVRLVDTEFRSSGKAAQTGAGAREIGEAAAKGHASVSRTEGVDTHPPAVQDAQHCSQLPLDPALGRAGRPLIDEQLAAIAYERPDAAVLAGWADYERQVRTSASHFGIEAKDSLSLERQLLHALGSRAGTSPRRCGNFATLLPTGRK
jgi:hypothetical protein